MECKWSKGFRVQGCGGGFAAYLYEVMPEGRTFASLSTLAENFFKNQKTVQYSEKFFHFWKFVHYTEQFEHGAERRHTYAASFLLCFHLVQGSRFKVQVAASPPFFRRWYSRIAAFPSREC